MLEYNDNEDRQRPVNTINTVHWYGKWHLKSTLGGWMTL